MIENLRSIDHNLFHVINNLSGKNHLLDGLAIFLAGNIFVGLWGCAILAIWFTSKKLRQNVYMAAISALVSRGIIVEVLKRIINRPRPYEALVNIHKLIIDNEHGVSFPSGHAVIYFSFAFAFWGTKYFWPFFILALIASVDRVYVGVHYPADIVVGAIIGGLTVWLIGRLFKNKFI